MYSRKLSTSRSYFLSKDLNCRRGLLAPNHSRDPCHQSREESSVNGPDDLPLPKNHMWTAMNMADNKYQLSLYTYIVLSFKKTKSARALLYPIKTLLHKS